MKDDELKVVAVLLEETYPKTYLRKNRDALLTALRTHLAPYVLKDVANVIREYARKYDTPISVPVIVKLANNPSSGKTPIMKPKIFEDDEGFIYIYDENGYIGDCIWKPWWTERGKSKMEELKKHGVIDY